MPKRPQLEKAKEITNDRKARQKVIQEMMGEDPHKANRFLNIFNPSEMQRKQKKGK